MKKILLLFLLILLASSVVITPCSADTKSVYIEFTYHGVTPSEFRVYCNNKLVYSFGPDEREGNFTVNIYQNRPSFVVAAVVNGIEMRSLPYVYDGEMIFKPKNLRLAKIKIKIKWTKI